MDQKFNQLFSEILCGFSLVNHSFFNQIYIKHLSYLEVSNLDSQYNLFLNNAISKKVSTYKEREEYIIKEGLWTHNDELNLIQNEKFIQDLRINYSKDYLLSRRRRIKEEISGAQDEINKLRIKKDYYIGSTAEQWANKKLTYYKIINSYFLDQDCNNKLVKEDDLTDNNYNELINLYNNNQEKFIIDNVKKIALSPMFSNLFYLSPDDPYVFYGKPVIKLTSYQTDIWMYGKYFKNILSQYENIPLEIRKNPDELIDWVEISANAREQKIIGDEENNGGTGAIVGATKEDYKALGIEIQKNNSLSEALKKAGGKLDHESLYKLTN